MFTFVEFDNRYGTIITSDHIFSGTVWLANVYIKRIEKIDICMSTSEMMWTWKTLQGTKNEKEDIYK